MRIASFLAVLVALGAMGCSGVRSLTDAKDAAGPPLAEKEQEVVRNQIQTALEEKRFSDAWNQEIELGSDRSRLEDIAVAALDDEDGDAEAMFQELRAKWGGLSEGARQRIEDLVRDRMTRGRWKLATELAISAADDPPAYAHAFRVYEQTPARKAPDVLQIIQDARKEAAAKDG